jgi:hypothetical protein
VTHELGSWLLRRVLPMSMPKTEGHSANVVEFREDALERKLLSMSRGGSNNQRLLAPSQKKGLAPARGAAASLPAGTSVQVGCCFAPRAALPVRADAVAPGAWAFPCAQEKGCVCAPASLDALQARRSELLGMQRMQHCKSRRPSRLAP